MQILKRFSDFGIETPPASYQGKKITVDEILNLEILIYSYSITQSKYRGDCLCLQISINNVKRIVFTNGQTLIILIQKVPKDGFPFQTTVIKEDKRFLFK